MCLISKYHCYLSLDHDATLIMLPCLPVVKANIKHYQARRSLAPTGVVCLCEWNFSSPPGYVCTIFVYFQMKSKLHKVEMIQHRAARFILDKPWCRNERDSVTQMISELNWPTLQHRRKCTRLTLLFKLLHQHLIIPNYYLPSPSPCSSTRNHNNSKFLHYQPRTSIYEIWKAKGWALWDIGCN